MARARRRVGPAMGLLLFALGCRGGDPKTPDGGGDTDAGTDAATHPSDADAGAQDSDAVEAAGPLTFVAGGDWILTAERFCDHDGDGALDNAIADLGSTNASLFAMTLKAAAEMTHTEGPNARRLHFIFHFPWVEDPATPDDPETVLVVLAGTDADNPVDHDDDLSGEEVLYALPSFVDACGEPRYVDTRARLAGGSLEASLDTLPLFFWPDSIRLESVFIEGRLDPHGRAGDFRGCAYMSIARLGGLSDLVMTLGEFSYLELFLVGGAAFGIPSVPGLTPDVDIDGDGRERFLLDENGHIEACLDGDNTPIPGRDCWRDERIADAFSVAIAGTIVPANLGGLLGTARWAEADGCDDHRRDSSLWDPCPGSVCERWASRPCTPSCGGDGVQECSFNCREWSYCEPAGVESRVFASCDDVVLEGDASCTGDPATVQLTERTGQLPGVRLAQDLSVGSGPFTLEGRVRVSSATTLLPSWGWSLVAYLGTEGDFLGPLPWGVSWGQRGVALNWGFHQPNTDGPPEAEADRICFRAMHGTEDYEESLDLGYPSLDQARPSMDSTTTGRVEQGLRLVIQPDLPETEANELTVVAHVASGSGFDSLGVVCQGDSCLTRVRAGDTLRVGIVASTGDYDANIQVSAPGGLRATAHGACP